MQKLKLSLLFILFSVFSFSGQVAAIDLEDKRVTVKMENVPYGAVLGYLSEVYGIPIGLEQSEFDKSKADYRFSVNLPGISSNKFEMVEGIFKLPFGTASPSIPVTITAENQRLELVLDNLVEQMRFYKWRIKDGVVNIFPKKGRNNRLEKLLKLKINKFTFEKGKTVGHIKMQIKSLPELVDLLHKNELRFYWSQSPKPETVLQAQYGRLINKEMNFSNLKFKDLLNKISQIKKGGWILSWRSKSDKTSEGYINLDI